MNKVVQGKGVMLGGNATNSGNAGPVAVNTNNAPTNSNANHGSHLTMEQLIIEISCKPCLLAKNDRIEKEALVPNGKKNLNHSKKKIA